MNQPAAFSPDALDNALRGPEGGPSGAQPLEPERDLRAALHETANALTVIIGWLSRAQQGTAESLTALHIAKSRAEHARGIIRRAIGADTPPEAPRSAESVARDAILGLLPEASRRQIALQSHIEDGAGNLGVEQGETVLQILTNLLLNALSASPEGAPIQLDITQTDAGQVLFGVSDRGPGIEEDRRATLFDAGKSTRAGGAGIGLRHAAALARKAHGELRLGHSGQGTRIELLWPRARQAMHADAAPPSESSNQAARLQGVRILLVEDDEAIIDLLDTVLSARGATVVTVNSQSALLSALAEHPGAFSAALVDLSPLRADIDGACLAMRKANPGVRLIFITGSPPPSSSPLFEPPAAWIRKPFDVSEIIAALGAASPHAGA